jgi:DNA-binding MarR family transcriptional regulator
MDGATAELGMRLYDLLKAIRVVKQRHSAGRPPVPVGLLALLALLAEADRLAAGCHARELAAQAALDQSTVSRAVGALVAGGLVAREPDQHDGRASVLVVTPAGHAALEANLRWYEEVFTRALDGWAPEEVAAFSQALERFAGALISLDTMEAAR